jgi:UDP-N-acetylmuramate--alanine ligase
LDRHLEPGDVLVTLGAGDVGTIADAFLRRLSIDRHA